MSQFNNSVAERVLETDSLSTTDAERVLFTSIFHFCSCFSRFCRLERADRLNFGGKQSAIALARGG